MPNYDYICRDCDRRQTVMRSLETPETKPDCSKCGKTMSRLFHLPAVTFNGTGWAGKED